MKILYTIPVLSSNYGGPISVLYQLTTELSKENYSLTILTSDLGFDKNLAKKFEDAGTTIISRHSVFNFGLFIYTPSVKKWIAENLESFDIIHMHMFRSYQNNIVSRYAGKYNIPYIVQAHGGVLPFFEKQMLKHLYDHVWGYGILKNASKIIALCASEAEHYQVMGVPEKKITIIPNGIDLSQFSDLPGKGLFRSKYDISEKERIILFLGRIHKIKGIDLLIEAYTGLLRQFPDSRLVIAGTDDHFVSVLKDQIGREKPAKIPLFTGPLYNQDKLEAFVDADVFVLPSRYDTFPVTVLEAWACGTPVIVTRGCLIADIVEQAGYVTGFDAVELKEAIIKTFTDEEARTKNRNSGLGLTRNEFNLTSCLGKIKTVYQEIIKTDEKSDTRYFQK